ncbi:MAG TPA: CPBP family intramembrane glutamic endopeptidase [Tepidisphaeraceae bacterium]|jgi:membrane protease YdiL (CAAX protease family)|nr:CPBP family intramembrane glutamic endopeptidase [Tepidisphaeraceae bacterium]
MSILGLPVPAGELTFALILLFLTVAGLLTAVLTGLLRPRAILGPDRLAPTRSAGAPVLILLLVTTLTWLGTQLILAARKQSIHPGFQLSDLTPADFAFLSTVPGLVAVLTFLFTFYFFFPAPQRPRLGFSLPELPAGLRKGFTSIFMILPVVLLVSVLTEWFYRHIGFKHPSEHELLRAMKDSSNPAIRWLLITGAVLIAPVTEELLFRGLFQTLLVWAYNNLSRSQSSPPTASRLIAGRWLAILVSSVIFASIHDKWSIPPIFILAICLGFTYERTGNLWVNITVHSLFNAFQTIVFLSQ